MAVIEKRVSKNGEVTYRIKIRLKGFSIQTATLFIPILMLGGTVKATLRSNFVFIVLLIKRQKGLCFTVIFLAI